MSFIDDTSIDDSCMLLRRIPVNCIKWDANRQRHRITSQAFSPVEMSIHIEDDMRLEAKSYEDLVEDQIEKNLAGIAASLARAHQQDVCRDSSGDSICHGLVVGKKRLPTRRAFATAAMEYWVLRIAPPRTSDTDASG